MWGLCPQLSRRCYLCQFRGRVCFGVVGGLAAEMVSLFSQQWLLRLHQKKAHQIFPDAPSFCLAGCFLASEQPGLLRSAVVLEILDSSNLLQGQTDVIQTVK